MRKLYLAAFILALLLPSFQAQNQVISDFEDLDLEPNSYWNGSDLSGGFTSGLAYFQNFYDTAWGTWSKWVYSNMADDSTAGYLNQYSAITAQGYDPASSGGKNYGVAWIPIDWVSTENIPVPINFADHSAHEVQGFYATNSTYAALSMEYGDAVAKKFGGKTGDDPDYFRLTVWGYLHGNVTDTVHFYLADYRFEDNEEDFIVKTWQWVDLTPLGKVDSLMCSLVSSDVGMFGMNTPGYFCIDHLTISTMDYIAEVLEYVPAPGQLTNSPPWGIPESAQSLIGKTDGTMCLGPFGGHVTFKFDHPVENHPDNPFGIDFTIFGNAMQDFSEPGIVSVMNDENNNGQADDTWYELAGSDHWFSTTIDNYEVAYTNPMQPFAADVPWADNQGNSGFIFANAYHTQPYYPDHDSFPSIDPVEYALGGTLIKDAADTSNPGLVKSYKRAFGYADNQVRGNAPYTRPDNPYTPQVENSGGDAFDIAWAIDKEGNYVDLDQIHFIKVHTAAMGNAGWLGELSTDITGAVDVEPDISITGPIEIVVIKDLPTLITSDEYPLEAFAFHGGRLLPDEHITWETNKPWASVNLDNVLLLTDSGELEIRASLTSNPSIQATVSVMVELSSSITDHPAGAEFRIFPNPCRDKIQITSSKFQINSKFQTINIQIIDLFGRLVEVFDMEHGTWNTEHDISHLPSGVYLIRIQAGHRIGTQKLIIQ